jgi:hypothetical protein
VSRTARFRVLGQLDMAGGYVAGTVEVDRDAATFGVRPLRRHRVYVLPLAVVATMVCQAIVRAELREKLARKRKGKRLVPRRKP